MTPEHAPSLPLPLNTLNTVATADLISELLTRYDEALFIGCKPTTDLTINGATGTKTNPAKDTIDVNSKINQATGMHGTLAGILGRLLNGLHNPCGDQPAKTPVLSNPN